MVSTSKSYRQDAGVRIRMRVLLCASAKQDRLDRFEQNRRVERQALVLDVVKIVLQFLPGVLDRSAVRILDLRPAREPGRDQMALFVEGNFLASWATKCGRSGRGPTKFMSPFRMFQNWEFRPRESCG